MTGAKIDRHNAKAEEVGAGVLEKNKEDELEAPRLSSVQDFCSEECAQQGQVCCIGNCRQSRMLAKRFNCTAPVHDARGFDPNVLPEDTG